MQRPDHSHAADPHPATTLLESFDSWAQLLRRGESAVSRLPQSPPPVAAPTSPEAEPYRPTIRRPLALLHVVDDGRDDGETIRLRGDRIVIGRTDGDVTIEHDISMSPRHALIERGAGAAWQLSDLGSAGGTFVRVLAARLHHGSCLQLGSTRLRFEVGAGDEACLVEILPDGDGTRHPCRCPATKVGRSGSGCDVGLVDRFVSPLHAEVRFTPGAWRIENRGLNGLWVRIDGPVTLLQPSQFQCGEQRFVFVPLAD